MEYAFGARIFRSGTTVCAPSGYSVDNETLRYRPTRWPTWLLPKCCDNAFLRSTPISYGTLIKLYVFSDLRVYYKNDTATVFNYQIRLLVFLFFLFALLHNTKTGVVLIHRVWESINSLGNYKRFSYIKGCKTKFYKWYFFFHGDISSVT